MLTKFWNEYTNSVEISCEDKEIAKASFMTGALAMILLLQEGVDAQELLNEITLYGIDCPAFLRN